MARATYLAPGVYVEEVPSAQQPIAGVGTNTVGFIGVVPDEIQYPESNPDYDPMLAKLALEVAKLQKTGAEVPEEKITTIDAEISQIDETVSKLTTEKENKENEVDGVRNVLNELQSLEQKPEAELSDTEKEKQRDRPKLVKRLKSLMDTIESADKQIQNLNKKKQDLMDSKEGKMAATPTTDQSSALKPYVLKTFQVTAEPFNTKLCTNFTEYTNRFGPFSADAESKPDSTNPNKRLFIPKHPGHRALTHAVNGFFKNGGTRCFVARVKPIDDQGNASLEDIRKALKTFESIDALAIIVAPGLHIQDIWAELISHCDDCEDRFAILDCPADVVGEDGEFELTLLSYDTKNNVLPQRNKNAAFYFPYIEVVDPAKQMQDADPARGLDRQDWGRTYVSPSGHIAGIYARTDEERGVHKAPANAAVLGALNVKYYVGKPAQALLNPQGVNCIRNINGNITVWGARTIGGDANGEWKYVSVRRFFLFLRESIDEGTQWCVFEPNDPTLWGKIRRNVSAFLTNVWRSGALFGLTPEEAFYVKCDAETNPPEVRDLGQVVTEIGVAIVRPAEFVIFRITQSTGPRTR